MATNFDVSDDNETYAEDPVWTNNQVPSGIFPHPTREEYCEEWSARQQTQALPPQGTMYFEPHTFPIPGQRDACAFHASGNPYNHKRSEIYEPIELLGLDRSRFQAHEGPEIYPNNQSIYEREDTTLRQTVEPTNIPDRFNLSGSASHGYGQPWNAAASYTSPILSPSPNEGDRNIHRSSSSRSQSQFGGVVVVCDECNQTLHGAWAGGNLARHQKSKGCPFPNKKKKYQCEGCDKFYQRSDGLLKHKRQKHGAPPSSAKKNAHSDDQ